VDFADLGLAEPLADFGFEAGRLAVLAFAVLRLAVLAVMVLALAAGFTDFASAAALPAGLAARFGLAREEGCLLFSFAMSPCFRHYRANAGRHAPRRSSNAASYYPVPPERARPRG